MLKRDVILSKVQDVFKELFNQDVTLDTTLKELQHDSLDVLNIMYALEGQFGISIPDDMAFEFTDIKSIVNALEMILQRKSLGVYTRRT